jgi:serine/threonine protein kinase/tetratricopeptide (TPR) repeat protein
MDTSSDKYDLLDQLAAEFTQRYRRGERPSLQEYIDRYPHLEADLRDLLPAMAEIEQVDADKRKGAVLAAPEAGPPLAQVGDYRIVREVGRGGMGVVYEAEQQALGRRVALKVLSVQALGDDKAQERFRREARAAARLHHTNIVPVFDVGQEGNTSYYAMQFIPGQSLDQVVEELRRLREAHKPSPRGGSAAGGRARVQEAGACRLGGLSQAAQALLTGRFEPQSLAVGTPPTRPTDAAPAGDLTADAGPGAPVNDSASPPATASNSAAGLPGQESLSRAEADHRHYFRSVARVGQQTALALAYAHARGIIHRDVKPGNLLLDAAGVVWVTDFGLAKTADSGLTRTGELPGTLRYMSPERFHGECDVRADVYALGLTLYEMLVLRPAFDSGDQCLLIDQIGRQEPPRPRSLDSQIPRDLETVVLRAIEKDPRRRYPSADELAEDLRRFLADEPVRARRIGLGERTRRWCLRNPWVAASVAAVVLVFLAAFAVVNVALWQARQAEALAETRRQDAESNEREARLQKKQADLGFARARKAVDAYLNQVTDGDALKAPGLQPLRRDLLGSALTFYQDFVRERRDDPALRSELAAVHLRVAKIQSELGNEEESLNAAREAVKLYDVLVADSPNDEAAQVGLIEAYTRANQAAKAVALGEPLEAAHPDSIRVKVQLAEAYNSLGVTRFQSADLVGTMKAYERSLRLREQLFQRDPTNPDYEFGLATALNNIGVTLSSLERQGSSLERKGDALVLYRHSLDHARNLFARRRRDFAVIRLLFRGLNNSSGLEETLGLIEQALKTNREGLELTQKLVKSDPDVPEHVYFCYVFAVRRAGWLDARDRRAEALAAYRLAAATSDSPLLPHYSLINSATWIGFAIAAARCAELIGEVTKDLNPEDRAEQDRLAALAVRHLHRGLDAGYRNPAFLKSGKQLNFLRSRADFQDLLTRAEKDVQPRKDATRVAKTPGALPPPSGTDGSKELTPRPPAAGESRLQARGDAAVSRYALGRVELKFGQREKAEKSLTEAISQFQAILRDDPEALRYRVELGRTRIALGDLYRDSRTLPEALRSWIAGRDDLLAVLKEVPGEDPLAVEAGSPLATLGRYLADFLPSEADPALSAARKTPFAMAPWDLLQHGLDCLMVNDEDGYYRTCERMLNGFPNAYDGDGWYSADVAVLCALDRKGRIKPPRYLPLAERGGKLAEPGVEQYRNEYLALAYYRAGKLDKALDRLDFCDRIATFRPALARTIRALVLHRLGRRDDAKRALEQARRWYGAWEFQILIRPAGRGSEYEDEGVNPLMVDLVRLVLREACSELAGEAFRIDQWRAVRRAWGEANFDRKDRARAEVDKVGLIDRNDADLLAARAFLLAQVGDTGRANADCEAALRIEPDHLLARYARGRLALAEGRAADAAKDLVRVLAQLPDLRTMEADRFIVDGLLASSDAAFQRAVELRPKDPQLWVARGRYLAWKERWEEAAEAYRRGVESQPIYYDWIEYGCALILAGDLDGYRQLCAKLGSRLKSPDGRKGIPGGDDPVYVAVRLAALHPNSGIDPKVMMDWAKGGGSFPLVTVAAWPQAWQGIGEENPSQPPHSSAVRSSSPPCGRGGI